MTTINLSITAPFLTYAAYANATNQSVTDITNAVQAGKLPIYTPPYKAGQDPARVKKYINVLALHVIAAESAGFEINVVSNS